MIRPSSRAEQIQDSITLAVSAKAAAMRRDGVDVVSFGAGEPDFDTPEFIKDAAKAALDRGETKYTPTPCYPKLREAIARKFKRVNGLDYSPEQITTGSGGKFCLYLALLALVNDGDEVIIPSPHWVSYPEQVKFVGATPVFIRGEESRDFKISPPQLEKAITKKTRAVLINSPCNPTGHAYTRDELKLLADVLVKHPQIAVISDEIYESLVYCGFESTSFATLDPRLMEQTITINCHSKSYAMTGWRVGYVGGPRHIIDAMNRIQAQTISHITSFVQIPAAEAFDDPRGDHSIKKMHAEFERRAAHMHKRLTELPKITCVKPVGAFYCFPNVSAYFSKRIPDAIAFARELLEKNHVAVVPGNDSGYPTHVRLSFATSMERIDKGIDRMAKFLNEVK